MNNKETPSSAISESISGKSRFQNFLTERGRLIRNTAAAATALFEVAACSYTEVQKVEPYRGYTQFSSCYSADGYDRAFTKDGREVVVRIDKIPPEADFKCFDHWSGTVEVPYPYKPFGRPPLEVLDENPAGLEFRPHQWPFQNDPGPALPTSRPSTASPEPERPAADPRVLYFPDSYTSPSR